MMRLSVLDSYQAPQQMRYTSRHIYWKVFIDGIYCELPALSPVQNLLSARLTLIYSTPSMTSLIEFSVNHYYQTTDLLEYSQANLWESNIYMDSQTFQSIPMQISTKERMTIRMPDFGKSKGIMNRRAQWTQT